MRYDIPFSDFTYPGWGVSASYEGTLMGFVFESSGPDFDVWVDEVDLYAGGGAGGSSSFEGSGGAAGAAAAGD